MGRTLESMVVLGFEKIKLKLIGKIFPLISHFKGYLKEKMS